MSITSLKICRDTRQIRRHYNSESFWIWRATSEAFGAPKHHEVICLITRMLANLQTNVADADAWSAESA